MPTPPPQGGLGQSWFVLDFEAAWVGVAPPPPPPPVPGDIPAIRYARRRRHPSTTRRTVNAESAIRASSVAGVATTTRVSTPVVSTSTALARTRVRAASSIRAWPLDVVANRTAAVSGLRARSGPTALTGLHVLSTPVALSSVALVAASQRAIIRARDEEDFPIWFLDL